MNFHSHYETLSVARNAPAEVIRAAYKALSQRHHPDRNPGNAEAAAFMTELNRAYATLSDPDKRAIYDADLAQTEAMINEWKNPRVHPQQTPERSPQASSPHSRTFEIDEMLLKEGLEWAEQIRPRTQKEIWMSAIGLGWLFRPLTSA